MFSSVSELEQTRLQQLGIGKDFQQQKIIQKHQFEFLKKNTHLLSLMVQFYEFIINEIEKDEYNDEITITKKE